jgi:hypothetical protein
MDLGLRSPSTSDQKPDAVMTTRQLRARLERLGVLSAEST